MAWDLRLTPSVREWLHGLRVGDRVTARQVAEAIRMLMEIGPVLGRPLVDRITGSCVHNLKELRPGSTGRSEVRILFAFDPEQRAVLLVAGDKAGVWDEWYRWAIPAAEEAYRDWLAELSSNESPREAR